MNELLVIAEHRDGVVVDATNEAIAFAVSLSASQSQPVVVAVVGQKPSELRGNVSFAGVASILGVRVHASDFDVEAVAGALEPILRRRQPTLVIAGQTVSTTALGPQLAVRLGLGFASNCVRLFFRDDRPVAVREVLAGKARTEVEFPGRSGAVVLCRPEITGPALSEATVPYEEVIADTGSLARRSRHVSFEAPAIAEADLGRATVVLTVGRGIGDKDTLPLFERVAAKLGAALGSTRPVVDMGWLPRSRLVGQSGTPVKPRVYLAFGVSGAAEHVAGMRQSGTIIAINTDLRAPIFELAQYGTTADAVEVAEQLDRLL